MTSPVEIQLEDGSIVYSMIPMDLIELTRLGDEYEATGEQALVVAVTLGLGVTQGPKCSIPYCEIGKSIAALTDKGYVVQVAA